MAMQLAILDEKAALVAQEEKKKVDILDAKLEVIQSCTKAKQQSVRDIRLEQASQRKELDKHLITTIMCVSIQPFVILLSLSVL